MAAVVTLNGSFEEGLARLARRDAVVIAGREVSAHQAQALGSGVQGRDVVAAEQGLCVPDGLEESRGAAAGAGADGGLGVQRRVPGERAVAAAVRHAAGAEGGRAAVQAERGAQRGGLERRIGRGRRVIRGGRIQKTDVRWSKVQKG